MPGQLVAPRRVANGGAPARVQDLELGRAARARAVEDPQLLRRRRADLRQRHRRHPTAARSNRVADHCLCGSVSPGADGEHRGSISVHTIRHHPFVLVLARWHPRPQRHRPAKLCGHSAAAGHSGRRHHGERTPTDARDLRGGRGGSAWPRGVARNHDCGVRGGLV